MEQNKPETTGPKNDLGIDVQTIQGHLAVENLEVEPTGAVYLTAKQYRKLLDILEDMPLKVGSFEKVSLNEWKRVYESQLEKGIVTEEFLKETIDNLHKPIRSTEASAGYDFYAPFDVVLNPGCSELIPTGIRVQIKSNWVLKIYPRSGLGTKYKARLDNTVGIIDSDYYYSNNEGHIMIKMSNNTTDKVLKIKQGDRFCQGIFVQYGITEDDEDDIHVTRNGEFNSTGR